MFPKYFPDSLIAASGREPVQMEQAAHTLYDLGFVVVRNGLTVSQCKGLAQRPDLPRVTPTAAKPLHILRRQLAKNTPDDSALRAIDDATFTGTKVRTGQQRFKHTLAEEENSLILIADVAGPHKVCLERPGRFARPVGMLLSRRDVLVIEDASLDYSQIVARQHRDVVGGTALAVVRYPLQNPVAPEA
ncbi:MAG TPA: hypothetical protein VFI74_01590 [Candidatus Saccharimonadales bacterium]|nr:hypothetical protein [Candidatus Saccharimonadales bacterium]